MFDSMILGQEYSRKEFKAMEGELRIRLFQLQKQCEENKIAVLLTILGVDGSGRGALVNTLSSWLDIKKLSNHTFWNTNDSESHRPDAWKYWVKLPAYGEFGIFFGGWYDEAIRKASYGSIDQQALNETMHKRVQFEHTLAENGYALAKFWLHLDQDEHSKRRKARLKEQGSCRFTPYDQESERKYTQLIETVSKTITMTDREYAPWYIIDAYDKRFCHASVAKAIIERLESVVEAKIQLKLGQVVPKPETIEFSELPESIEKKVKKPVTVLDRLDLSPTLERDKYKKELKKLKQEVFQLSFKAYQMGISSTLTFEGWDAGGKGGTIRRVASAVDSRITRIIPVSAPTDEELAHHYLWRFWRHVPLAGYVTIYDRTWYGRVLVERVEKFAKPNEWKRAYAEINNFEEQLVDGKNILLKFWLHISEDEQLKRFKERENTPWKNYKLTDEDWRNREKSTDYKVAADEMFMRTNTEYAPWHIIPANSKYYARIEVLKIYRDALKKALKIAFKEHKELDCDKDG